MHIIICSRDSVIVEAAALAFQSRPAGAGSSLGSDQSRVTLCESGLEVLGAVGVMHADLLVLDMQTPGLDAWLITSAIRELAPNLPIVAVSTKPEEDSRTFSHKGVSWAMLPSGSRRDGEALAAMLAQFGGAGVNGVSSGIGTR